MNLKKQTVRVTWEQRNSKHLDLDGWQGLPLPTATACLIQSRWELLTLSKCQAWPVSAPSACHVLWRVAKAGHNPVRSSARPARPPGKPIWPWTREPQFHPALLGGWRQDKIILDIDEPDNIAFQLLDTLDLGPQGELRLGLYVACSESQRNCPHHMYSKWLWTRFFILVLKMPLDFRHPNRDFAHRTLVSFIYR